MKLAVIGASRGSGRQLVNQAHLMGLSVTAIMRHPGSWPGPSDIPMAQADVMNYDDVLQALVGHDTVAFCVGPVAGESTSVLRDGMAVVLEAMKELDIRRLIAISSSGHVVNRDDPFGRFIAKPILARVLREVNADLAAMETVISGSTIEWTIVRPPRLLDKAGHGRYRQRREGNVRWRYSITRSDLAKAMLDFLADPSTVHQRISVAN